MCNCHHKIHWSVISVIVNIVSIVMFLTAIATPHWAEMGGASPVNTGLFQTCVQINRTCYDTSYYFDTYSGTAIMIMHARRLEIVNVDYQSDY